MDAHGYVQRLVEISQNKYARLERVLQTYLEQKELLETEDGTLQLDACLNRRQQLMEEIDKLDEQFVVYGERLKNTLGISSYEELSRFDLPGRATLKDSTERIISLLQTLSDYHHKLTDTLSGSMQALTGQMKQLQKSKQVHRAYQPANGNDNPSVYFDKRK